MASTQRTFDVALSSAPQDAAAARALTRQLTSLQLRVTRIAVDPANPLRVVMADARRAARVNLRLIGRRSVASCGAAMIPVPAGPPDPAVVYCIAPGVADVDARRCATAIAEPVWDLRSTWHDASTWHALSDRLVRRGIELETEIEPLSSLGPSHLRRVTIGSYDHLAEQYASHWFDHIPERELERFLQMLRPKSRILDVGCGPGHHSRVLATAGHEVIAIDLSAGMLEQARRRVRGVRFLRMDMCALEIASRNFDAIWCAAAILHVPREHLPAVLCGFWRVMKPRGLLGLNFQVGRPSELVHRGQDRRFFEYYAQASEVADLLRLIGFSVSDKLDGQTTRNTHALDMTLSWSTLYARREAASVAAMAPTTFRFPAADRTW